MKKRLHIVILSLFCLAASVGIATATATDLLPPSPLKFTPQMVSGKTMISSGYAVGSMTFNSNGTLTCNNYPDFISCKSWWVQPDGVLRRHFTDSHTGKVLEIQAYWTLLSKSGNSMQVNQTSNNSPGQTVLTVTIK